MKLTKSTTVREFNNGYWYHVELQRFARTLGIVATARMRKDELESAITAYLRTGQIPKKAKSRPAPDGVKDLEKGLSLGLRIARYTSGRETKNFIAEQALRQDRTIKHKSGVWYRLNRWRDHRSELEKRSPTGISSHSTSDLTANGALRGSRTDVTSTFCRTFWPMNRTRQDKGR